MFTLLSAAWRKPKLPSTSRRLMKTSKSRSKLSLSSRWWALQSNVIGRRRNQKLTKLPTFRLTGSSSWCGSTLQISDSLGSGTNKTTRAGLSAQFNFFLQKATRLLFLRQKMRQKTTCMRSGSSQVNRLHVAISEPVGMLWGKFSTRMMVKSFWTTWVSTRTATRSIGPMTCPRPTTWASSQSQSLMSVRST